MKKREKVTFTFQPEHKQKIRMLSAMLGKPQNVIMEEMIDAAYKKHREKFKEV